jgi:4-amino-4-deoxy-L-arabinose transferase-like glycosyltransferase
MMVKFACWIKKHPCLITALMLSIILLPWIWGRGLQNPDETRYGAIALEMFNRNDFIIPYLNGVPYLEKSPLLYWLGAISIWVFGSNEGGMRIWPFLSGLSIGTMSAFMATRFYGKVAGLNAGLVAVTTLSITVFSQVFNIDLLVAALITAALACFLIGMTCSERLKKIFFILLYLFCALAVLAKGLIGIVFPAFIILSWCIITHRIDVLRSCFSGIGLVLFFGITIPWHYFAEIRQQGFLDFYFINEHLRRFTTNVHHRNQPLWFFPLVLVIMMMPWTGYLFGTIQNKLMQWRTKKTLSQIDIFFILWAAFIFLFFLFSHSKLPGYLLPVIAPLVILIGKAQSEHRNQVIDLIGPGIPLLIMLGVTILACPLFNISPFVSKYLEVLGYFRWVLSASAFIAAMGFLRQLLYPKSNIIYVVLAYLPFLFSLNYSVQLIQPKSIKHLILSNKSIIQNNEIAVYKTYILDTNFYLNKPAIFVDVIGELKIGLNMEPRPDLFITSQELRNRLSENRPIFVILNKDRLLELPDLQIIDQQGDIVLAKNLN